MMMLILDGIRSSSSSTSADDHKKRGDISISSRDISHGNNRDNKYKNNSQDKSNKLALTIRSIGSSCNACPFDEFPPSIQLLQPLLLLPQSQYHHRGRRRRCHVHSLTCLFPKQKDRRRRHIRK